MLSTNLLMAMAGIQSSAVLPPYRYWRIYITLLNSGGANVGLEEIELRGTVGGADLTTGVTPVLASSFLDDGAGSSYPPSATVDGYVDSPFSLWYSATGAGFPHWARYDLATAQAVAQVAIKPYPSAASTPRDFKIQGSNDGTSFTDVKAFTGVASWTGWKTFDLT